MEKPGSPRWLRDADNTRLNNLIREYADIIVGIYSAHQHSDTYHVIYRNGRLHFLKMLAALTICLKFDKVFKRICLTFCFVLCHVKYTK